MDLGDMTRLIGKSLPGRLGGGIFIVGVIVGLFYWASTNAFRLDIGSFYMEEGKRCGRSLEIAGDALRTHDMKPMIEDNREGNCMGKKMIESADSIIKDSTSVLNPLSAPDPDALEKLQKSANRFNEAASSSVEQE